MSSDERIKKCCILLCRNTTSNNKVKYFTFPEGRFRHYQRDKWVQIIRKQNGQDWAPTRHSRVCSEHFVHGHPSKVPQNTDYVPTIFNWKKKVEALKSRTVSLKRFALEYMKHKDLLEWPLRASACSKRRKVAYERLAAALDVPVATARAWEQRFRQHVEKKLADPEHKRAPSADGTPHWMTTVQKQLYSNPMDRLRALSEASGPRAVSARGLLEGLCMAARARGVLCGSPLYNDVRRALRLSSAVSELHAVWVAAQRVAVEQVRAAGRAGDADPPDPPHAEVADLVLLHTDVDMHRLVSDESVTLYEESSALHTLWQLVQQHRLEESAAPRERAQRWTRAHRDYRASGRSASIVVLQRRWHELKLQARVRLAAHWRRPTTPSPDPAPPAPDPTPPAPDPTPPAPDPTPPAPGPTPPAPHDMYPRPAPLHIAILKRYPHVATGPFKCWHELVLDGSVVLEPLEEENDVTDTQSQDSDVSTLNTVPVNDPAVSLLYPNLAGVDHTYAEHPVNEPSTELTANMLLKHCLMNELAKQDTRLLNGRRAVTHLNVENSADDELLTAKTTVYDKLKQSMSNELLVEQSMSNDLLVEQSMSNDLLVEQSMSNELLVEQSMSNELLVEQSSEIVPLAENCPDTLYCFEEYSNLNEIITKSENCSDQDTEDNLVIDEFSNMTPYLKRVPATERHSVDTVSPHTTLRDTAPTIEVLNTIDPSTVKKEILFDSDEDDFLPCNEDDRDEIKLETEASGLSNKIVFADEDLGGTCQKSSKHLISSRQVVHFMSSDVTDSVECRDAEDVSTSSDSDSDTPTMDPKLLMETTVPLFRIDKTRAWRNNVRKDQSIRVSRIHRRYYTPKRKVNQPVTQETRVDKSCVDKPQVKVDKSCLDKPQVKVDKSCLDKPQVKVDKSCLDKPQVKVEKSCFESQVREDKSCLNKSQEIRVDKSCLDKVANTHSIKQLCMNIKREMIDEFEVQKDGTPNKKVKVDSDSDEDKPLTELRKEKRAETDDVEGEKEMVEESSSDDERANSEMLVVTRGRRAARTAASTISWTPHFEPVFGRVARRVCLPDIQSLRWNTQAMRVAQVAPITSTTTSSGGEDVAADQPVVADDDTPLAWRPLDLPAGHELQAALDDLTLAASAELERRGGEHCCAARRQREVNDTRRRLGLPLAKLHTHEEGACTCCCAHLSDVSARRRLSAQLRALHHDIERMLCKPTGGIHSKTKHSRSQSPSETTTTAKKPLSVKESTTVTKVKRSKDKPDSDGTRPKRVRKKRRVAPPPAPPPAPATPLNDYEEWQRQKNVNAQYFHINRNPSSKTDFNQSTASETTTPQSDKKKKITPKSNKKQKVTPQSVTQQSITPLYVIQETVTPQNVTQQNITPQNVTQQSVTPQNVTQQCVPPRSVSQQDVTPQIFGPLYLVQQSVKPQNGTHQIVTPQDVIQQTIRPQNVTQQIVTPQNVTQQSVTTQSTVDKNVAPIKTLSGLMPYIRESRLVTPNVPPDNVVKRKPCSKKKYIIPIQPPPSTTEQSTIPVQPPPSTTDHPAIPVQPPPSTTDHPVIPLQPPATRRMSKEQPVVPLRVTSEPNKPVSILEEYSRTLSVPPGSINALSLHVPADQPAEQATNTTIVMALTLPSNAVGLYSKDTIDLTEDKVAPAAVDKGTPVVDIMGAVKRLMSPGEIDPGKKSFLECLRKNASRSLLKTNNKQTPSIMSLCKPLKHGDVIEIEDSDSNEDDNAAPTQVKHSDSLAVYSNKSANQAKTSDTKDSSNDAETTNTQNISYESEKNDTNDSCNEAEANKSSSQATGKTDESINQAATTNEATVSQQSNDISNSAIVVDGSDKDTDEILYVGTSVVGSSVVGTSDVGTSVAGTSVMGTSDVGTSVVGTSDVGTSVAGTSVAGTSVVGTSVAGASVAGTSVAGISVVGTSDMGTSVVGTSVVGTSDVGTSVVGTSVAGTSVAGTSVAGTSVVGTSDMGTSVVGTSVVGTSDVGTSVVGTSVAGTSVAGTSVAGTSVVGTSDMGTSVVGTSVVGTSDVGTSDVGTSVAGTSVVGTSDVGTSDVGTSVAGTSVVGTSDVGTSDVGTSVAGTSVAGTSVAGTSVAGTSVAGACVAGTTVAGTSVAGTSVAGTSVAGTSVAGTSVAGTCVAGTSVAGTSVVDISEEDTSVVLVESKQTAVPALPPPTDRSARCRYRRADVTALTYFMKQLRRVTARIDQEEYSYKSAATHVAAGALPCGGTLLCVDASCAPLVLRGQRAHEPHVLHAPHGARDHLVLTCGLRSCAMPTYWTLQCYRRVKRVVPEETAACNTVAASSLAAVEDVAALAANRAARGLSPVTVRLADDRRMICENQHQFQILTAFSSVDDLRRAVLADNRLLLFHVESARVCALTVRRHTQRRTTRYRVSANVEPQLLKELEAMLDEAETDEEVRVFDRTQRRRLTSTNKMQIHSDAPASTSKEAS